MPRRQSLPQPLALPIRGREFLGEIGYLRTQTGHGMAEIIALTRHRAQRILRGRRWRGVRPSRDQPGAGEHVHAPLLGG